MKAQEIAKPIINNYSGVKIDIHNPTVNAPANNNQGYAKPDFQIYNYEQKKIPADYYQQVYVTPNNEITKPIVKVIPQLPDPKPVAQIPESVLEPVKTVPVPNPVFVETTTPKAEPIKEVLIEKAPDITQETQPQEQMGLSAQPPVANVPETTVSVAPVTEITPQPVTAPIMATPAEPKTETFEKQPIEIIPPVEINPPIDRKQVYANLRNPDYDIQALQLKDIVDAGLSGNPENVKPYIVEQVFLDVINLVNVDSTKLAGPTDAQLQIRTKIIENMISAENQKKANVPENQIVLPHQITEQDFNYGNTLSPLELAERNKSYAITALALLSSNFLKQVEEETGNIVPITDVPGLSAIVNTLKGENYNVKLTALDALIYLQRPEYARELAPIYTALAQTDPDEIVRRAANEALVRLQNTQTTQTNNIA